MSPRSLFFSILIPLLIPSLDHALLDHALLDQTWDAIGQAEVWDSCFRRTKKDAREKSVFLFAYRIGGNTENASAWALVFACVTILVFCLLFLLATLIVLNRSSSPRLVPYKPSKLGKKKSSKPIDFYFLDGSIYTCRSPHS